MGNSHAKKNISIHPFRERDLDVAIVLHESLIQSAGSILGKQYLRAMYTQMLQHPDYHVMLGAYDGDTLVGAILATRSILNTNKLLRGTAAFSVPKIVWNILTGAISISEIVSHSRVHSFLSNQMRENNMYITALYVSTHYQRKGIATQLIHEVLQTSDTNTVYIDTHHYNTAAVRLYETMGFAHVTRIGPHVILRWECT